MKIAEVAKICHEANKALCESMGDFSQKHWNEADEWQRESGIKGVTYRLANPDQPIEAQHNAWCNDKILDGWHHGPVKDAVKKEHPCLVPFEQLPALQQLKDRLFVGIVLACSSFVDHEAL